MSDKIQISYHGVKPIVEIFIYDLSGKELKYLLASKSSFYDPLTLDVSNLSAGVYLLELKTTESITVQKLVKR